MGREVLVAGAGSAGELNDQALAHEVRAIWKLVRHGMKTDCTAPLRTESYSKVSKCCVHKNLVRHENSPGTTSRASIASLYSMKPKPFMSLISVISPVP